MRGKYLTYIAMAIMISLASTVILGTKPASAQGPTVFMTGGAANPQGNGDTPLTVFPRVAANAYFFVFVKIKNAPHVTNDGSGTGPGGTDPSDLTWAYQVSIHWNPTVLSLIGTNTFEPGRWTPTATTGPNRGFLKFAYWWTDYADWYTDAGYDTSFAKTVDTAAGTAIVGMTLLAQDPGTPWNFNALPPEMNPDDPNYFPGCPDEGYHDGIYYDLPYSVLNKYDLLVRLRFQNLDPGGAAGTMWSPIEIVPGTVDTKLKTIGQTDVIPECITSYYGSAPPAPEFPFGLGVVMMIAPAVALMYLWRTRKPRSVK